MCCIDILLFSFALNPDKLPLKLPLGHLNYSPHVLTCENRKKLNKSTVIDPFKVKT